MSTPPILCIVDPSPLIAIDIERIVTERCGAAAQVCLPHEIAEHADFSQFSAAFVSSDIDPVELAGIINQFAIAVVPVCLISADSRDGQDLPSAGAIMIAKPFSDDEIADAVRTLIAMRNTL